MKIRLSDPDRARLGCPEWLDYDPDFLAVEDAEALQAAGGKYEQYPEPGPAGGRVRVWVALHRAGVTVTPFEALTFNIMGLQFDGVGKAPSAKGGRTTRSTSATSSRRSPRKRSAN